jgi:outer membrane protein TolC
MYRILLSFALVMHTLAAFGQGTAKSVENWQEKFFQSSEVVLPILIDAAIKYSAQIENLDAAKQIALANQSIERKRILSGLSIGSSYSYGSVYNLVDPTGARPVGGVNPFNLPTQSLYNVGAQAGISLFSLLGRRYDLQKQVLLLKQADVNRKLGEREIRRNTINLYQEIVLAKAEQEISQESYQLADLRFKLAEKQFAKQEIEVDKMVTVQEFYARARTVREAARIKYETAFLMMEELIGMKVIDLMNSK